MTAGTQSRQALPPQPGAAMAYEYERNGVSNLFMLFAPLEGWRRVEVTDRRIPVKGGETPGGISGAPGGAQGGCRTREDFCIWTCARKVRGGVQLRVVGLARSYLCKNVAPRTDVAFCTICRYDSDRAGVQEKCPAVREGGTGGVLV